MHWLVGMSAAHVLKRQLAVGRQVTAPVATGAPAMCFAPMRSSLLWRSMFSLFVFVGRLFSDRVLA